MNRVILSGFLSQDAKITTTRDGDSKALFTVACQRRSSNKDAQADFVQCEAWNQKAKLVENYFGKGKGIEIEGHLKTDSFTNKDGHKVFTQNVICDVIEFPKLNKSQIQSVQLDEVKKENTSSKKRTNESPSVPDFDAFVNIPEGVDEETPFA